MFHFQSPTSFPFSPSRMDWSDEWRLFDHNYGPSFSLLASLLELQTEKANSIMLYLYLNMHACSLVPYLSLSHIYTHTLSLFHTHSFTCSFTSLSHSHYQNPYSDAPVLNHLNLIWIPLTHWTLSLFFSLSPTLLPAHLSHLRRPSLLSLSLVNYLCCTWWALLNNWWGMKKKQVANAKPTFNQFKERSIETVLCHVHASISMGGTDQTVKATAAATFDAEELSNYWFEKLSCRD